MIAGAVYLLCALTSSLVAALMLRNYRRNPERLLFWFSLCFIGLALNNLMLVVDLMLLPEFNMADLRPLPALGGMMLLVWGLIWEVT